jgi:hypothetical protein
MTCLVGAEDAGVRGTVQNLSARGVALVVRRWFQAGEVVPLRLFNEEMTVCLRANLQVVRRCTLPDGEYFIAGELDRTLEPAELMPFLI